MKIKSIVSLGVVLAAFASCSSGVGVSSGAGALFTSAKEGISANNGQESAKMGKSCGHTVLGLVAFGDSSVQSAKREGNIKNVATVDRDYLSILGFYGRSCLIVSGN